MQMTRPPAVAGMFYPGDPKVLKATVDGLLAGIPATSDKHPPKVLIAPHAGYIYSGSTAARAYALLKPWAERIRRVVLLGPTHRVAVRGIALPASTSFATPLGEIALDTAGIARLSRLPGVVVSDPVHAEEHSLEVHLPFLQRVLDDFLLLPLAVGQARPELVADVLDQVWGGEETLIVISSDLSHFLPYATASDIDRDTCEHILQLDDHIEPEQACGAYPINGLLLAARRRGLQARLLGLCNSGDTAGDKLRVVGYGAFSFWAPQPATQDATRDAARDAASPAGTDLGPVLLGLARHALEQHFGEASIPPADCPALHAQGASFVTLTQHGNLRGCIGSLEAWRPLGQDVQENALAAALRDPRFPPLTAEELPHTRIEVSLLTPSEALHFRDQADALAQLRPGIDGIILAASGQRATFLPQVWEQLPDRATFMAQLKRKAGLPADYWGDDIRLERYTVKKWKEPRP